MSSEEVLANETSSFEGEQAPVISRRNLIVGCGGAAALLGLGCVKFVGEENQLRPPGGQDFEKLVSRCLRCGKCIEACPHQCIKFTSIEEGVLTVRMPRLTFEKDYCTFCEDFDGVPLCAKSCATRALELEEGATAQNTLLGIAEVDPETCLAFRDTGCMFCFDACPYEAIVLDEYDRPVVITDKCNGCGACEAVCVSLQNASIYSVTKERAIVVRPLDRL